MVSYGAPTSGKGSGDRLLVVVGLAVVLLAAACTSGRRVADRSSGVTTPTSAAAPTTAVTSAAPLTTAPTTAVTSAAPSTSVPPTAQVTTRPAAPSSSPPVSRRRTTTPSRSRTTTAPTPVRTHDGVCPYLSAGFVMDSIGQHLARITLSNASPPVCAFYRPDGGLAARVEPSHVTSPAAARRAVLRAAGGAANPLPHAGDGGVVSLVADGAVAAASIGTQVVVVTINQRSSLEATEVLTRVLAAL